MTRDDIIRMARVAGLLRMTPIPDDSEFVADIERFAALVEQRAADAEREACAQIAWQFGWSGECRHVAAAIRARSK